MDVTVINPDSQSGSLANAYTYLAPFQIAGVNPTTGPSAGGTGVTITGTGFLTGAHVLFDGLPAAVSAVSADGTSISAATPAHPAGVANIIVVNPNGQRGALSHAFTFTGDTTPPINAALTITQVEPAIGPTTGGARVAIHGAGFKDGVVVAFDTTPGTALHIINSTLLVVSTPGHAAGTVTVTVSEGSARSSLDNGYGYIAPPEHRPGSATSAANGPTPAPIPPGGRNPHALAVSAASVAGGTSGAPVAPNPVPPSC